MLPKTDEALYIFESLVGTRCYPPMLRNKRHPRQQELIKALHERSD
jgi:hypothetical protein